MIDKEGSKMMQLAEHVDILNYENMVHSVAQKYKGRGIEYDDLVSAGYLGLVLAQKKFDASRGCEFSTLAFPYIKGEILHLFRKKTLISRGRTLCELGNSLSKLCHRKNLIELELTESEVKEIADELGVAVEDITMAINSNKDTISINNIDDDNSDYDIKCTEKYEIIDDKYALKEGIKRLEPIEKQIVYLRFWHGKTQREIGDALGMSQVQASRYEKRAVNKLKHFILDL